tara:strand:- start:295 stop:1251 length:957 start_codon:yes stop_codon:yes gene_type:complete
MKVLVTGITGMVGSHLAEYIVEEKLGEVYGLVRWRSPLDNIKLIKKDIKLINGDLNDLNSLIKVLQTVKPDKIFHLAAQSYVQDSFSITSETLRTNVIGTTNLLDAVKINKLDPLIHICSSSEVYGQVLESEIPIKENNPLRPASPYAVSKVGEDFVALQYFLSYGLRTIRTRMFTHTGPRRGSVFAESAFAKQIAEIEAGIHPSGIVKVGNLDSVRTFSDVRDAVRAYWLLLEKCKPGDVYNIGGTETMTVGQMLEILKSFSKIDIKHKVDAKLLRPSDVTLQIPDCSKFLKETNWKPRFTVEETLQDLLNYHRQIL